MGLRDAVLGISLYLLAGLLLGRRQRRHRRLQSALATSSLTDRLTGVYNYGTFVDHLRSEVRRAERYGGELTLVMLDLDHFKRFNDAYGHQAGNELLRSLGATLRELAARRRHRRPLRRRGVRRAHPAATSWTACVWPSASATR